MLMCVYFLRLALAGPDYIMHEILNSVLAKHFVFMKWLSQSAPSPLEFIDFNPDGLYSINIIDITYTEALPVFDYVDHVLH